MINARHLILSSLFHNLLQRGRQFQFVNNNLLKMIKMSTPIFWMLGKFKKVFSSLWKDFYNLLSPQYIVCKQLRLGFDLFYLSASNIRETKNEQERDKTSLNPCSFREIHICILGNVPVNLILWWYLCHLVWSHKVGNLSYLSFPHNWISLGLLPMAFIMLIISTSTRNKYIKILQIYSMELI